MAKEVIQVISVNEDKHEYTHAIHVREETYRELLALKNDVFAATYGFGEHHFEEAKKLGVTFDEYIRTHDLEPEWLSLETFLNGLPSVTRKMEKTRVVVPWSQDEREIRPDDLGNAKPKPRPSSM